MAKSELFGDWGKAKHIFNKLATNHDQYERVIESMGHEIAERLWDIIESQSIDMAPLQEAYRARKVAEGYDERIVIKTGDFLNSLKVTDIQSDGENMTVFIGVEDGMTESGISMQELAVYIENGTVNQPARMPITLSWEAMRADVTSEVSSRLKAEIEGALS